MSHGTGKRKSMPQINFTVFIPKVEDGSKPLTIRAMRKRKFKVGDKLLLFQGLRSSKTRRLITPYTKYDDKGRPYVTCIEALDIEVSGGKVVLAGNELSDSSIEELSRRDGFDTVQGFFNYHDGLKGQVVWWAY